MEKNVSGYSPWAMEHAALSLSESVCAAMLLCPRTHRPTTSTVLCPSVPLELLTPESARLLILATVLARARAFVESRDYSVCVEHCAH
jgi:hypothetical protein